MVSDRAADGPEAAKPAMDNLFRILCKRWRCLPSQPGTFAAKCKSTKNTAMTNCSANVTIKGYFYTPFKIANSRLPIGRC